MDTFRHVFALLFVVTVPAAVGYWFAIHPFIAFWRRLGTSASYTILIAAFVAVCFGSWLVRDTLLGRDLGARPWLYGPGLALYGLAVVISVRVRRHLRIGILAGVPEIRGASAPAELLDQGIYARVRHPRYLAFLIGSAGIALIVNYSGVYVMSALVFLAIHAIVVLEERELRDRFGDAYVEYAARVPRFIPGLRTAANRIGDGRDA